MTSFPKPAPLDADNRPGRGSVLLYLFFSIALVLCVSGTVQLVKYREISKSIALLGSAFLAVVSAAVLLFPGRFSAALIKWCTLAVALLWTGWAALIAYAHHVNDWDEGAYLLSGLALRGYDVPYAAHRPPVTGIVCAAFIGWERFLNPVLLSALLILIYLWVRRLLGPSAAMLSLLALFCQNLLLENTVDIMSELPATLLLSAGFFALAREKFWWSSLCLGLVMFARWNLAPIWWVVFLAIFMRFGWRQALKFMAIALAILAAWYMLTVAMGTPQPLLRVIEGNLLAGPAWRPEQKHHFLLLAQFYGTHFFFLTPPVLLALVANPLLNWRKRLGTELWISLVVMPLASLSYLGAMLVFGGPFARFMVPVMPLGIVSLLVGLSTFSDDRSLSAHSRLILATTALFVTCAVGLWPLSALVHARVNLNYPGVFSADLGRALRSLDRTTPLYGVPRAPLSYYSGNPAMVEARHRILFPTASRDGFTHNLIEEPDSVECVRSLVAASHTGDLLIIPAKYASDVPNAPMLFSDNQWAVIRKP